MAGRSKAAYRGNKRRKEEARKARQSEKRTRRQARATTGEKGPPIEELPEDLRPVRPGESPEPPQT